MKIEGLSSRILELLSGNGFHSLGHCERKRSGTDGQTDRRTRQKQYVSPRGGGDNMSPPEGGRHKYCNIIINFLTQKKST